MNSSSTAPSQSEGRRLRQLQAEIEAAERTLAGLRARIDASRGDGVLAQLERLRAENERLSVHATLVHEEVDSAHAALDAAIRASETDALTGLPNRLVLWDRLGHAIAVARRSSSFLAVYFLDLDGFKGVNDRFGHAAGDRLLQVVATRLTQTLRASDTVCRIGGDEFVVVVQGSQASDVQGVARKILAALDAPFLFEGRMHTATASIGWSAWPQDGDTPEALVRHADAAMYQVKRRKKEEAAAAAAADAADAPAAPPAPDPAAAPAFHSTLAPGDEAPAGTPGTGDKPCPACGGSGRASAGGECACCAGAGRVTAGIG